MRFWTSFGLNWLEFNLLEHSFCSLSSISARFGANYDKRIVAILYSKIFNIILISGLQWLSCGTLCFYIVVFFIVITMGQKEVAQIRCGATDEVEF